VKYLIDMPRQQAKMVTACVYFSPGCRRWRANYEVAKKQVVSAWADANTLMRYQRRDSSKVLCSRSRKTRKISDR
jgi:hypothetical protein